MSHGAMVTNGTGLSPQLQGEMNDAKKVTHTRAHAHTHTHVHTHTQMNNAKQVAYTHTKAGSFFYTIHNSCSYWNPGSRQ